MNRTLQMGKMYLENTGKKNISDYFTHCDVAGEDVISFIREHIVLETDKTNYIQVSEIQGYYYDLARILKPVFQTFAECNSGWRYCGVCFKFETTNRF